MVGGKIDTPGEGRVEIKQDALDLAGKYTLFGELR